MNHTQLCSGCWLESSHPLPGWECGRGLRKASSYLEKMLDWESGDQGASWNFASSNLHDLRKEPFSHSERHQTSSVKCGFEELRASLPLPGLGPLGASDETCRSFSECFIASIRNVSRRAKGNGRRDVFLLQSQGSLEMESNAPGIGPRIKQFPRSSPGLSSRTGPAKRRTFK